MKNFRFSTPTEVVFGKGSISNISELIDKNERILIIYGGGSIKKNGVYDQVINSLSGYTYFEFCGIEPNPKYETCVKAIEFVKSNGITFLLSVGGGSVLDATKFIAAAACLDNNVDPWNIILGLAKIDKALPIGDVITLPATGSEMNGNSVISRISTQEKLAFHSTKVIPRFSIIDPTVTFSLPTRQVINGVVDTFVHVMEQYCTYDVDSPLQDLSAIAIIRTLVEETPKALSNPNDYNSKANLFWCATLGLNTWIAQGVVQDWSTHMLGHELTAFYGIDHAQSLAIVLPRLWKYKFDAKKGKLAKLAKEVWKVDNSVDDTIAAQKAIVKTVSFFESIGMKTHLSDYGINPNDAASKIKERLQNRNISGGEHNDIDANAAEEILLMP